MRTPEHLATSFREGIHNKNYLILVITGAVTLLGAALIRKYGKTIAREVQDRIDELHILQGELEFSIKNDDAVRGKDNRSAAYKAKIFWEKFVLLAHETDLEWSDKTIQALALLSSFVDHQGPNHG